MNTLLTTLANSLWCASCLPQSAAFHWSVHKVAHLQQRLLLQVLRQNAGTAYGRQNGFATIHSVSEFQDRVPLTTYEDYQPLIERIAAGEAKVLTTEPVQLLEPTSGSTAASKLIPYTAALKAEFQRALAPWLVDLYLSQPSLLRGQAYWSVTPAESAGVTDCGDSANAPPNGNIPIGFEDDSEYLSPWQRRLAQAVLAVPAQVRLIDEMEAFRYVTLLFLLRSRSLALVSVWNPTFFSLLVSCLGGWATQLIADIAQGTLHPPTPLPGKLLNELQALNQPDMRRANEVSAAFRNAATASELHARLWPHLRLISCWADAHAASYAEQLVRLFPQARVQGKGLLATEGFVTFPLKRHAAGALAYRSHFFEFIATPASRPLLAHELKVGERYSVVLTTGGGFYRYQLHDLVEVAGWFRTCPLLRFIGKTENVSDWFGEKLNEQHVSQVLHEALTRLSPPSRFTMLACETRLVPPAYTLFIETEAADDMLRKLIRELETALQENFHYRYCRSLGQLGAVRVFRIRDNAAGAYLAHCQAQGQRAGDIKLVLLHRLNNWAQVFCGAWIEP